MINSDVVIIGAGSTGLMTAYYLYKLGVEDVTILEKGYAGSGSTGRCGTGIRAQFADEATITMMKQSENSWNNLADQLGFEFRQTGYLYLLYTEEEVKQYQEMQKLQNSLGVHTEMLSPYGVKELCTLIDTTEVIAGSYNPEDGKAHPFEVITRLKKYFQEKEVDLKQNVEVTGITLKESKKVKVIETSGQTYQTEVIVNAAGGWTSKIGEMIGVEVPVEPYRHQAIITEPFKEGIVKPMVVSMKHQDAYLTQTERGGIIGGVKTPKDEPPTYDMTETLEFEERVSREFSSIIPSLKHARILRHWAGYYSMSPDSNPLIGEYKVPGHYLAGGFSGHGYMMAPSAGRGLAEVIVNSKSDLPLDYYDPERIDRGEFRKASLQMG